MNLWNWSIYQPGSLFITNSTILIWVDSNKYVSRKYSALRRGWLSKFVPNIFTSITGWRNFASKYQQMAKRRFAFIMKIQRILNQNECEEEDRNQKIHLLHSIAQLQHNQRWLNATCNFWPGSGPFQCLNQPIRVEKTKSSPTLPSLLLPVTCVLTTTLGISLDQSEPAKARSDSSNEQTSAEEGTNYWRITVTNISQYKSNQLHLRINMTRLINIIQMSAFNLKMTFSTHGSVGRDLRFCQTSPEENLPAKDWCCWVFELKKIR